MSDESTERRRRGPVERGFEWLLWNSRFLILIAVVASMGGALAMFALASLDLARLPGLLLLYRDKTVGLHEHDVIHGSTVALVAGMVDGFLFAVVLLIFALGLYELFISKIELAEHSEFAERLLLIRSLDDLKDRLSKVIFLILVVRYFEFALQTELHSPLDALYLAVGIILIAGALYMMSIKPSKH